MLLMHDGEVYMMPCMELMQFQEIKVKISMKERAQKVIAYVRKFLDETVPIDQLSWNEISEIKIKDKDLVFLNSGKRREIFKK